MNSEALEKIEEFDEELDKLWEQEKLDYADNRIYALGMILHSITEDDITLPEALNEFFHNTNLEIDATITQIEVRKE